MIESLTEMMEYNRSQPSSEKDDIDNLICPDDGSSLLADSKGRLHCEFCGRVYESLQELLPYKSR